MSWALCENEARINFLTGSVDGSIMEAGFNVLRSYPSAERTKNTYKISATWNSRNGPRSSHSVILEDLVDRT